jgi:hypothetical protein
MTENCAHARCAARMSPTDRRADERDYSVCLRAAPRYKAVRPRASHMLPQSKKICTQRWAHEHIITNGAA